MVVVVVGGGDGRWGDGGEAGESVVVGVVILAANKISFLTHA